MNKPTSMNRRTFLQGLGAAAVLVAGGAVWRARSQGVFSSGEGLAYEPWKNWRTDLAEGPVALVRAAILAANPHDTQPWLFRVRPAQIEVYADLGRRIGATDPFLREMHLGLGCAVENLLLAAAAQGYLAKLHLLPDAADANYIARVELTEPPQYNNNLYKAALSKEDLYKEELFKAIPLRHTNRGRYAVKRPLTPALLEALTEPDRSEPAVKIFWFTTPAEMARMGTAIVAATGAIIADDAQSRDSAKWFRAQWSDVQAHRDGITLDATGLPGYLRALAKLLPVQSAAQNDRFWLKTTRKVHVATAAAFGIMAVQEPENPAQAVRCGRIWQRLHLTATTLGVALQPLNQMPERAARETILGLEPTFGNLLRGFTGGTNWESLLVFRAGYPLAAALPSPRRSIAEVIIA